MDSSRATSRLRSDASAKANRSIRLASSVLGERRHVCAFFNSREEEYRVTLPFIKDGIECGDKAVHIINPARCGDHLQRMASAGIDTASVQRSGQLELHDWADTFFRDGSFDPDRQLALLEDVLESGRQQGFPVSRYVAHAEWALEEGAGVDLLLEFEAKVNQVWPRYADAVICTYDLARFRADVVIDVIRTHPMVIIGGIVQQNPFFVQPDEFLEDLRERRATRVGSLRSAL
jgi:DcmR-like sensory protein